MNNISFIGMAGCGKSTLGKAIAEKYDLSFGYKLIESNWQMTLEGIKTKYGYETVIRSEQEVILNLDKSIQIISRVEVQSTQIDPWNILSHFQRLFISILH